MAGGWRGGRVGGGNELNWWGGGFWGGLAVWLAEIFQKSKIKNGNFKNQLLKTSNINY